MNHPSRRIKVGLISDTHGLLRPQALDALRGSDFIIHAGDIGDPGILEELAKLAPVTAVRGNNDFGDWASHVPETAVLTAADAAIYVIHDVKAMALDPAQEGYHAVVAGHSHRPGHSERNGVLYINPGSAGPRRFSLPVSVGALAVTGFRITPQLVTLCV